MNIGRGLGITGALLIVLSAPAHSLMGWPAMRDQLRALRAPIDLERGLMIAWHFGGVAMLALGLVAVRAFLARDARRSPVLFPAAVVAVAYLLFGGAAALASGFDPFFLVFIVPGGLLAAAVVLGRAPGGT